MELTAQEFVQLFGTDIQKNSFEQQNKIATNIKKALISQAETEYESVKVEKRGRSNVYVLVGKRDESERVVKKDGRHSNGAYSITYTKNVDLIVLSLLLDKSVETDISQTMRKWLLEFGLIGRDLFDLMGFAHDKRKRVSAADSLIAEKIISNQGESSVVDDYLGYTKELQNQLESSLNRMRKSNIINFYPVYWAKLHARNEDGKLVDKRVRITEKCVATINEYKRKLMGNLNVTNFDIMTLHNKKEVKQFNEIYKRYLSNDVQDEGEHISIDYFYKSHAIHIKATDERIEAYLNKKDPRAYELLIGSQIKFMNSYLSNYKDDRLKRVIDLANRKVEYVKNNKLKIDDFPEFLELFGEDSLLDSLKIEFNRDYYKMILKNDYVDTIKNIEIHYSLT